MAHQNLVKIPSVMYLDENRQDFHRTKSDVSDLKHRRTNRQYIKSNPTCDIVWMEPCCDRCGFSEHGYWSNYEHAFDECAKCKCNVQPIPYRRIWE